MAFKRNGQPQVVTLSTMTFVKPILIVLGLWLLWFIRDIVIIVLAAILLAALIEPFASWLEKKSVPRAVGVIVVYIVLGVVVSLVFVALVPVILEQMTALFQNFGTSYKSLLAHLGEFQNTGVELGFGDNVNATLLSIQNALSQSIFDVFSTVKGVLGGIAAFFIVLVLAFYMVLEEDVGKKFFKHILPEEYQPFVAQLFVKMQRKIGSWMRGQIILGCIIGLAVYIGLSLLNVPYALLLAVIAGLLEVVPYVGPVVSLIPAAIVGFAASPLTGLFVLILYFVIQQLENNLFVPKIMEKVTGLNPVVSIIALLIGIKLGGVIGAILSIPVATMSAVILEDLFKDVF